jgi:hypothetical protein
VRRHYHRTRTTARHTACYAPGQARHAPGDTARDAPHSAGVFGPGNAACNPARAGEACSAPGSGTDDPACYTSGHPAGTGDPARVGRKHDAVLDEVHRG